MTVSVSLGLEIMENFVLNRYIGDQETTFRFCLFKFDSERRGGRSSRRAKVSTGVDK